MTIAGHGNGLRPVRFRLLAVRVSNAIAYVILNVWSNDAYVKSEQLSAEMAALFGLASVSCRRLSS